MTSTEPVHTESETHSWKVDVVDHPQRADSPEYVAARKQMNEIAAQATDLIYGTAPYQDHHGGALWLKDAQGWFLVRNLAGIEWSAQFCADPAKVDLLRQLWVTDGEGNPAAVAPVAPRGSGNASIHVLYATPGSQLAQQKQAAESVNAPLILGPNHPLAQQAFTHQQAASA